MEQKQKFKTYSIELLHAYNLLTEKEARILNAAIISRENK